jgi:phosphate transport system permease protein
MILQAQPLPSPLRAPAPTFAQQLPRALSLAGLSALGVSLAHVVLVLAFHLLTSQLRVLASPGFLGELCYAAARLAVFVFVLTFLTMAVFLQRPWQERAFRIVGVGATFTGLGMLAFFFVQLGRQAALYFEVMPVLIEQRNEQLARKVQQAEQIYQSAMAEARQQLEADVAAAPSAAEKQEIRAFYTQEVLPARERDLKVTAAEAKQEAEVGSRSATSAGAIFRHFVLGGPSDRAQDVGILPALMGSIWLALITILFAVPVGVGAALYLEEYRSNTWLGALIQLNINNLAGVPSVVFGILGAFVFVEMIFKPLTHWYPQLDARNLLGGGLTLGLLTLPIVIVSAQEAIRAVPVSIRQGAYALGATRWQVTRYQVLPMAMPGILTGTILALSRAVGEAAPLVLFGALQFVDHVPTPLSRFTAMPLQIFGWAERPAIDVPGYAAPVEVGHTIAALISVLLLAVLLALNATAIYLRHRAQRQTRV